MAVSPGRRGTEFGNQIPVSALGFVGSSSPVTAMLCKLIHCTLTANPPNGYYLHSTGKEAEAWISLAVQWLRLHVSNAGVQVQFLVRELRSDMLCSAAKK